MLILWVNRASGLSVGASGRVAGRSIFRSHISVMAERLVASSVYSFGGGGADSSATGNTGRN